MRMMETVRQRFVGAILLLFVLLPNLVNATPLGSATIRVLGIQVDVDTRPDVEGLQSTMTAVKDFPTAVHTVVGVPGMTTLPTLPEGSVVKAELAGPGLGKEVLTLASLPNQPLEIPQLAASGDHFLYNIRLEDSAGRVILPRAPTREPVVINVIEKLLVTQVTSRALTLDEIKEKGIVIDEDNFTAVNFTVGLTLGSEEVAIELPVVLPTTKQAAATVEPPKLTGLASVQRAFDRINIPNFSLSGFQLRVPPEFEEGTGIELPPINGVIVIPGNIGFLNQFFSVILQATNIAPDGSGLVLKNTRASIVLPVGEDDIIGTGDDPLRVAETEKEGVRNVLPLLDPQEGTDTIVPQGTNQAEFLVEGLREGTQKLGFDITGDLYVPSLGKTVVMTGKAAGVVQVKNPTFSIVLSHPDVVREGEAYSIFATVTNTSTTPANMFQLALNTPSLSGARLADEASDMHTLEALNPGQAESFEFKMVAQTTGEVTGTVFLADEGINGSFVLTAGVGDTGIPLSPDTLVLPKTVDYLPDEPDMLFQAVRMLGQAYSVATAPAGSLPPAISRISKGFVFERAVKLAQVGLHVRFGEPLATAVADIIMDTFGNDMGRVEALSGGDAEEAERLQRNLEAFDGLRRAADAGNDLSDVLGELLGTLTDGPDSMSALQKDWAATFASRPPHLSYGALSEGAPVFLRITDPEGKALGRLEPNAPLIREIPFADRLPLVQEETLSGEILFQAVPVAPAYTLEWAVLGSTTLDLSLILPGPNGLIHVMYDPLHLDIGGYGRLGWSAEGENGYLFEVDRDGDGTLETTLEPIAVEEIIDPPPRLVGVVQWAKGAQPELSPSFKYGEPLGRMLGILYSEEVTRETALDAPNYQVEENRITEISLQPDRRLAFAVLERPVGPFVERSLTVTGVADPQGHFMVDESRTITADPERGVGGTLHGQVISAEGDPVPFAGVKYIQPLQYPVLEGGCMGGTDVADYVIFNTDADAQGRFTIDFVLRAAFPSDCPSNPDIWLNENNPGGTDNFKLEAMDPESGEVGKVSAKIHYDGQRMRLKVVIRGYGSIRGTVVDEEDNLVRGGNPFTSDVLWVHARNISTGEMYRSWVDGEGFYSFPREFTAEDGRHQEAPKVVVGNLILHLVRPQDGYTAVTTVNLPGGGAVVEQDLLMVSPLRYGKVTGRVLEAGGLQGAPNVLVQIAGKVLSGVDLYSRNYSSGVVGATHTDGEGFFRFENIPAGDIEVRSVRQATYEEAGAKSVLAEGGEASLTLVYPGPGGTVRGIVRDAFGKMVPKATVAGGPTLTETDEEGFFEVTGLPLGSYTFYAQSKDSPALGQVKVQTLGPDDVQEVIITLEPTGSVEGTVFRADGVTPVRQQRVQLWLEPNRGVLADVLTDQNGAFRFKEYPLGDYSVRAIERDHGDGGMTYTAIRFAGDNRDADITFRGMGEIKGRVVQSNGTPVMSDVIVTRKVWRIFTDEDAQGGPKIFMAFIREVQSQLGDAEAEQIEKALQDSGLSKPGNDFFMLIDESVLVSSDIKGPNGEVTGGFQSTGALAGPFKVAAFGPFLAPAEIAGEIPKTTQVSERRVDVGDVVLEPATSQVKGTIYLPDGKTPVGPGISVKIRSLDSSGSVMTATGAVQQPVLPEYGVVTDNKGQFNFPLVLRGRFILTADTGSPAGAIKARGPEQMETARFADEEGNRLLNVRLYGRAGGAAPAGETLEVSIRLHDVAGLKVMVVADDGKTPVPYAKVSVKTASVLDEDQEKDFQQLNADVNGEISFFPVIEGRFSVGGRHSDSPARGQAVGTVPQDPENGLVIPVTVTLGAVTTAAGQVVPAQFFGTVEGTVFKADGTPQDNPVQVTVKSRGVGILTTSDAKGRYRAEDVPGGALIIEAFEPFTARRGSAKGVLKLEGQVVEIPITLVGLGTVTGSVMNNDGSRRMAGLDVLLYPTGRFTDTLITRSDPQGSYTLPGVPLGPFRVKAVDPHSVLIGEAEGVMVTDGEQVTMDVRLEPSGRIGGILYGAGTNIDAEGNPVDARGEVLETPAVVANASIVVKGPRIAQTVQTNAKGEFLSGEFLPLGEYTLMARPVKGEDGVVHKTTVVYEGETVRVPLALSGRGVVTGVILDSLGKKPVATARVTLISRSPFSKGPVSRFTKEDGVFRFEGVPVESFSISSLTTVGEPQLRAATEGTLERHAQVVALRDDDPEARYPAIRLQPAGEIAGRALHPDGQTPAEKAIVTVRGKTLRLGRFSDEKGAFQFEAVPLGTYTLAIREPSTNAVAQRTVQIEKNGQVVDLAEMVLDAEPPKAVKLEPGEKSVGVSTTTPIAITFSEPIEPTSVQGRSFRVTLAGKPVHGRVEVSSEKNQASFFPAGPLPDLTAVRVAVQGHRLGFEGQVLEPGVMDLAGQGLSPPVAYTFTTGDFTKPSVTKVSPAEGAGSVPLRSVFRVEFSEPVDPQSIKTFTLMANGKPMQGRLNTKPIMGGRVLVFTPAGPLLPNTAYTAVIQGPVRDLAGNAMEEAELKFNFATRDTIPPKIQAVAMATGMSAVSGKKVLLNVTLKDDSDVALVEYYLNGKLAQTVKEAPFAARVYLDPGLGERMTVGAVAVDRVGNRSTQALLPITIAPNTPPTVRIASPGSGQVSAGQIVALQISGSDDVGIAELGFTANQGQLASGRKPLTPATAAQQSFTFKVPMDFPIGDSIQLRAVAGDTQGLIAVSETVKLDVLGKLPPEVMIVGVANDRPLDPGAKAPLQVAADDPTGITEVSLSGTGLETFSEVRPFDPAKTRVEEPFVITIPIDASPTQTLRLTARAVDTRGNAGSRDVIIRINDRIAPTVTLGPRRGKPQVEPGAKIVLRTTARDEIGVEHVDLLVDGEAVQTRAIRPTLETTQDFMLSIENDTTLDTELNIQTAVKDAAGNVGIGEMTLLVKDLTAPKVQLSTSAPENLIKAGDILNVRIKAEDRFGVAALKYRVGNAIKDQGEFVMDPVETTSEREFAVEVPSDKAGGGTIDLLAEAYDGTGNRRDTRWFHVRIQDVVPPEVVRVRPPNDATDVIPTTHIRLDFSEGIARKTGNMENILVRGPAGPVAGAVEVEYYNRWVIFKPTEPLERGKRYTVTATAAITDPTGNPLKEAFTSSFTTDNTGPAITELLPTDGADGVEATPVIRVRFNEALKRETLTPEAFSLVDDEGETVPAETTWRDGYRTLELRPTSSLSLGGQYGIRLTGQLTDAAGNSITTTDGQPIEEMTTRFTIGSIRFISPRDGQTVPEQTRITLEISPEGLAVNQVIFEVNGRRLSPVPGPVFRMVYHVPPLIDTKQMTITAVALDEKGNEIARKSVETTVTQALQRKPPILGVAMGEERRFRLSLSVSQETDLPINLNVQDPSVARLSQEPVVLKAGETNLWVPLEGLEKGNTFVTIQSERGNASLTVSVGEPLKGVQQALFSLSMGLGVQPPTVIPPVRILKIGAASLALPMLSAPAGSKVTVEVSSSSKEVVEAPERITIEVGSCVAVLPLKAKTAGETDLTIRMGDTLSQLRLIVGEPPPEEARAFSAVSSRPVGVSLTTAPSTGPINLSGKGEHTLVIPFPFPPVKEETPVKVSSSVPDIVMPKGEVTIAQGRRAALLTLTAKTEGQADLLLIAGEKRMSVPILVGDMETALPRVVASSLTGISVPPSAFPEPIVIPHLGKRQISVPLLPSVVTEETFVTVTSDQPEAMEVPEKTVIPAGSRMAQVSLHLKQAGSALLKLQVGDRVTWVPVMAGPAAETVGAGVMSVPLGMAVIPAGTAARLFLIAGTKIHIQLPLLSVPATKDVPVEVRNRDPKIAQASAVASNIAEGRRTLEMTLTAPSGAIGTALTELHYADTVKTLAVIVGPPTVVTDGPKVIAPVVGLEVKE